MDAALEEVISNVVHEQFAGSTIEWVKVEPDLDSDGDPILDITVVFASDLADV